MPAHLGSEWYVMDTRNSGGELVAKGFGYTGVENLWQLPGEKDKKGKKFALPQDLIPLYEVGDEFWWLNPLRSWSRWTIVLVYQVDGDVEYRADCIENGAGDKNIQFYPRDFPYMLPTSTRTAATQIPSNPALYCTCNGPSKENWAGGEKFFVCTSCRKEKSC
jgi:hypothetical protein